MIRLRPPRPAERGKSASRIGAQLQGGIGLGALGLAWEATSRLEVVPSKYFPPLSETLLSLVGQLGRSELWVAIGQTMSSWLLGLSLAALIAVPIGLLLGRSDVLYSMTRPVIEVLKPIPPVVFIPAAILILGTGLTMKLALIVYVAVWPLLIQTISGARDIDPIALATARLFKLSGWLRFRYVVLPGASGFVATGLRVAASFALITTIVTELVAGAPGLGQSIFLAQTSSNSKLLYGYVLVSGVLGMFVFNLFTLLEKRALRWHPSQRKGGQ